MYVLLSYKCMSYCNTNACLIVIQMYVSLSCKICMSYCNINLNHAETLIYLNLK